MTSLAVVPSKPIEFEAHLLWGKTYTGSRPPHQVEGLTGTEPLYHWYQCVDPEWMVEALLSLGLITLAQAEAVAREVGTYCRYDACAPSHKYRFHGTCVEAAHKAANAFGAEAAKIGMAYCGYHDWLDDWRDRTYAVQNASDGDYPDVQCRFAALDATRAAFAAYWDCRQKQLAAVRSLVTPRQILDALDA
jgi:hypothetical protein